MVKTWIGIGKEIHFHPDIIANGFSEKQCKKVDEFRKTMLLRKKGLSMAKIAKTLNIPGPRVFGWVCEGKHPPAINAIEAAKRKGWLPISTENEKFVTILDVFAWIFGDGSLKVRRHVFLSGQRIDLEKIASKITENLGLKSEIKEDPGPEGKNSSADTCRLTIKGSGSCLFGRLLIALRAPEGNKVKKEFLLPDWVFELKPKLKKRFLEVFLSNEASVGNLGPKETPPSINIKMRKMKHIAQNLIDFLNQIGVLLNEFGIETLSARTLHEISEHDGIRCVVIIKLSKQLSNMLRFSKTFKLIFARKKQKRLNIIKSVLEKKIKAHLEKFENFKKAMKLRETGLGCIRVARLLNINRWLVNGWFRDGRKPMLFNKRGQLKESLEYIKNNTNYITRVI